MVMSAYILDAGGLPAFYWKVAICGTGCKKAVKTFVGAIHQGSGKLIMAVTLLFKDRTSGQIVLPQDYGLVSPENCLISGFGSGICVIIIRY